MNEIEIRKSSLSAMSSINKVEGFDPRLLTTCYVDSEGVSRMYLQAEPSMLWFRLKYPGGKLEQILTRANDQMATVEGRVYDDNGNLLANAFATRYHTDDQFGKDYIQNAGTAAIRKALGNCGFGTPADAEFIEGVTPVVTETSKLTDAPVDGGVTLPIPIPVPVPKPAAKPTAPAEPAAPAKTRRAKTAKTPARAPVMVEDDPFASVPVPTPAPIPVPTPAPAPAPAPQQPKAPAPSPEKKPGTVEEALAFVIPMGRYNGKTIQSILDAGEGKNLAFFLRESYRGTPVQAAVQLVAGQYNL